MNGLATSQFTRIPPKQDPPFDTSHCSSAMHPPDINSNASIRPGWYADSLVGFSRLKDDSSVLDVEGVGHLSAKLSGSITLGRKASPSTSAIPGGRTIAGGHCPPEIWPPPYVAALSVQIRDLCWIWRPTLSPSGSSMCRSKLLKLTRCHNL